MWLVGGGLQGEGRLGAGHGLRAQGAHQIDGLQVGVAHHVVADAVAALGEHEHRRRRLEGAPADQLGDHLLAPLVDRPQAPARLQREGVVTVAHAIDAHVGVEAQARQGVGRGPAARLQRQPQARHQLLPGIAGADEVQAVARLARADRLEEGLPVIKHVLPVELPVGADAQGELFAPGLAGDGGAERQGPVAEAGLEIGGVVVEQVQPAGVGGPAPGEAEVDAQIVTLGEAALVAQVRPEVVDGDPALAGHRRVDLELGPPIQPLKAPLQGELAEVAIRAARPGAQEQAERPGDVAAAAAGQQGAVPLRLGALPGEGAADGQARMRSVRSKAKPISAPRSSPTQRGHPGQTAAGVALDLVGVEGERAPALAGHRVMTLTVAMKALAP